MSTTENCEQYRTMENIDIYYLKLENHVVRHVDLLLAWPRRCIRVDRYLSGVPGWSFCDCLTCSTGRKG